jgi:dihydroxyacetone kinase
MTRLWNDPSEFADEMIDGFVAANGRSVRRVPGGVVRSTVVPDGQVVVIVGREGCRAGSRCLPLLRQLRR